ncbi:peptidoglycan DD-metalloendopeptidase family protein [Chryseobacterium sp.]|uniref:peptidoglycan DD-metalloendopeptidase family protein n=1 Tax=Chryseobacterium sp. TaxID=1871047 RepID=UPI0028A27F39|nr:peptidoglycan DD-metalloendopeptidase family protein [Chryseobacterium sp.]
MSKQGIYKISGNTKPKVGEQVTYKIDEWYPATPIAKRNPAHVTWHLFKKVNGKFVPTNIKKVGVSSFTFNTTAYKDTFRIEAYLHNPEGRAPMALEIQPQPSDVPKINKVELKYIDDTPGTVFSFTEKLVAEARCMNLEAEYLLFTLWEDDARDSGHSTSNTPIDSKKEKVKNGIARAEFMLTKALMRKAMQGEANPQQMEFYVTVEYYAHKKHATNNVNVSTPDELRPASGQPQPQPQPQPQQPQPQPQPQQPQQPQPAPVPAQPEPEPQSAHGTAHNTQPATSPPPGGVSPTTVNPVKAEDLLDAYFAKKEYIKQTGEEDGTHTYTFGGTKSGNKTGTAEEKNKVAQTILGKIKDSLKSQKKYTTLEVIAAALTAEAYGKDTVNQKTVTFKTFKLGPDFKKVDSAPLDDKLYLVARTMMLEGKQVTISIKEKDGIIKGAADAVLPVLEITEEQMEQKNPAGQAVPGTEKTVFTGTVKDNMVKIPIHLRPKSEEELKQWKDKISKGKEDGTYTYTFGGATNIDNEAKKTSIAKTILDNAKKGNAKNPKIESGKTSSEEEIKKVLAIKNYQPGDTITFKLLKKVPEFLYLHAKAQGDKQHDKKFLNKEGAYFQIGNKCPRCEAEITLKQIEDLFGVHSASTAYREEVAKYLNQYIQQRKTTDKPIHLDTCLRKAHFFAQVGAETSGINTSWIVETDVNPYSPANVRNPDLFGERGVKLDRRGQIEAFCAQRPQIKLLSFLYAHENGKGNGNGNEASGDGYKFRGRGLKQLTGRENYRKASLKLKEIFPDDYIDLEANPDKVKEVKYAVLSALAYWENNEVWKVADEIKKSDDNSIKKIRRTVNGATAGWESAKKHFEKGIEVFKVNECSPVEKAPSDGKWHDPVDNPQLCLYSQGGESKKPWHGSFGPTIRDGVNKHTGMDLFAKPETNVYACVKSKVVRSEINSSMFGQMIVLQVIDEGVEVIKSRRKNPFTLKYAHKSEIESQNFDHNGPFYLVYAHLKERKVAVGDIVNAGKIIGLTGTSGNNGVPFSTKNPHLHFEIMNVERQAGLNKKCNPGVYLTYKDEDSLTPSDIAEQEDARKNSKFWKQ